MLWWQIALIVYGGINLALAIYCTIVFAKEGYYVSLSEKRYGKINWGVACVVFVIFLFAGLPIAILGIGAIMTG